VTEDYVWDLSEYSGIKLEIAEEDCMLCSIVTVCVFPDLPPITFVMMKLSTTLTNGRPQTAKKYTFVIKDDFQPRRSDGREQSTVSWEYDFQTGGGNAEAERSNTTLTIPWSAFEPSFRGKPKPDSPPIDVKQIRRFSLLMRRYVHGIVIRARV